MKTYTPTETTEILRLHKLWLDNAPDGVRANLHSANLSSADLYGANLSSADLRSADLSSANLYGANLYGANLHSADLRSANLSESQGFTYAQVSWTGHGERGRQLTAIKLGEELKFFCGCFQGTEAELRQYIANGSPEHVASRTKALEFVLSCF